MWLIVAFIALISSAGAQETQQPATNGQPEAASDQSTAAAARDGNPAPEPGYAERFLTAVERIEPAIRELIAEEDKVTADAERERDDADLRAQQSMAVWAFWMFVASALSVVLTGVGVVLIWRTLLHTRDAAIHAGAAVLEAKNATKAAQDAVDVT
ncbi:MAG: hypothetical protein M9955_11555 [Rhizobiaceae bacterium]|nr:hypothetical protein [Rhizobiaceae bacterium]